MGQAGRVHQVRVTPEFGAELPPDLRALQRVGEPGPREVTRRRPRPPASWRRACAARRSAAPGPGRGRRARGGVRRRVLVRLGRPARGGVGVVARGARAHLRVAAPSGLQERRPAGFQPGDRHPERRAGHVVEADLVEEVDGLRVTAVLAADARVPGPGGPPGPPRPRCGPCGRRPRCRWSRTGRPRRCPARCSG